MVAALPPRLVLDVGAPAQIWYHIMSPSADDRLFYDVLWVNKTATRLPEACSPSVECPEFDAQCFEGIFQSTCMQPLHASTASGFWACSLTAPREHIQEQVHAAKSDACRHLGTCRLTAQPCLRA